MISFAGRALPPLKIARGERAVGIIPFPAIAAIRAPSSRLTVQRPRHPGALALAAVSVGSECRFLAESADALAEIDGHGKLSSFALR